MVALNLVVNALCQSATTRLSRLFSEQRYHEFCRLLFKLAAFGMVIVLAGVPLALVFGRGLLTILYRPQYAEHVASLAILVAAAGVSSTAFFITSGLNSARCFRAQLPIFVSSTSATILSCLFLVPRYQLNGAAMALLLSAIVGLLGNLWVLRSTLRSADAISRNQLPHMSVKAILDVHKISRPSGMLCAELSTSSGTAKTSTGVAVSND